MSKRKSMTANQKLEELVNVLDDFEPDCGCDFPTDEFPEDGVILCLACDIRQRLELGATHEHAKRFAAMDARLKARSAKAERR